MEIALPIHILIHVAASLLAGIIVWRIWKNPAAAFLSALISGVAVDFDHFIDYFLAFGWSFNFYYFTKGYEFLKSNKMYTLFHGWEYAVILLLAVFLLKNKTAKTICLALSLGLFFHLGTDVVIDKIPIKSYSIINKIRNNFEMQKLVTPEHWQKHEKKRERLKFE